MKLFCCCVFGEENRYLEPARRLAGERGVETVAAPPEEYRVGYVGAIVETPAADVVRGLVAKSPDAPVLWSTPRFNERLANPPETFETRFADVETVAGIESATRRLLDVATLRASFESRIFLDIFKGMSLEKIELLALKYSLDRNGRNRARTARELGVSEKTVYNNIRRYRGFLE